MADKSIWAWIGMGCAILLVIGAVVVIGGGYWLFKTTKEFGESMKDPEARTERVLRVLGAEELPEGYHAMVALTIPFVMKIAVLSDRAPGQDGQIHGIGERGFFFIEMINTGQNEEELRGYFEGETSDPGVLRDNNINIDVEEIIDRGILTQGPARLMYVAQRGSVSTQGFRGEGLTALVLVDCPSDEKMRMAVWFGPDTANTAGETPEEPGLAGTPADPNAIAAFLGRFRLCPAE